ncbi:MAG TPA: hypothetical protein VFJ68_01825, partial [Casimicrobiaceae bacterium]|nr:hypothetical protein [Casimicrobiaceae bacterium]
FEVEGKPILGARQERPPPGSIRIDLSLDRLKSYERFVDGTKSRFALAAGNVKPSRGEHRVPIRKSASVLRRS